MNQNRVEPEPGELPPKPEPSEPELADPKPNRTEPGFAIPVYINMVFNTYP